VSGRWVGVGLIALLAIGLTLRVWNINFDQGIGSHPDERSTACYYAPTIGLPSSWDEFMDPQRSPLNPLWDRVQQTRRSFTYGHFPLYLGVAMGEALHHLADAAAWLGVSETYWVGAQRAARWMGLMARANQACDGIAVAGRLTIALLDTLTIGLVFALGRRVLGAGAGLLAAAFYTFTAQAVQLSHFFAMDPASTTFTVLAVLGGVKMVQQRTLSAGMLTGVGAGLAVAAKFSALPVLAVPVTAGILWGMTPRSGGNREGATVNGREQLAAVGATLLALLVAGLMFAVTSPYAVLDWGNFAQATLVEQGQMVRGVADFPFTRQYRNTTPYVYFIQQQIDWGMGRPLGWLALLGAVGAGGVMAWSLGKLVWAVVTGRGGTLRLRPLEMSNLVMWSWIVPYFGLTGAFLAKFNRYMSPLLPFAALFAAAVVWLLWRWGAQMASLPEPLGPRGHPRGRGRAVQVVAGIVGGGVLAAAVFWSAAYVNGVYGREHTWITASRWIYQNAPRESVILWELWDDPLPKAIPGEAGMDMGQTGLRNIDWSPYEEDTAEKYAILKQRLREADYVVYSSKRIYDSVDELPERYPMTLLYYAAMWDGRLGFELAAEFTSPPRLFGWEFDDRHADESWSLYDHPQVTVFRKVRDLSDAEFDALFNRAWEQAIPYYRGKDSPLSPILEVFGLGSSPSSGNRGLVSALVGLLSADGGQGAPSAGQDGGAVMADNDLLLDLPLVALPVVDNYRWNAWASASPWAAAIVWYGVFALLGWIAWPLWFWLLRALPDRGYVFSRTLGWLVSGWLLWLLASAGVLYNTVLAAWGVVAALAGVGAAVAWWQRRELRQFVTGRARLLLVCEGVLAAAFAAFVLVRLANPDLWQPWFGGEKFMEFAFLNGILRSPTFPPVNPHFAGGVINYYYFGLYLAAFVIKLTGIYAEVAFNLTIPMLFALTVGNAYVVALAAWRMARPNREHWSAGLGVALWGPALVTVVGNLDGFGQIVRQLVERSTLQGQSALPGVMTALHALSGLLAVVRGEARLAGYDFWGPSRVIPNTINEFPYWSFLFADLHPHLIGIPLAVLFVGVMLAALAQYESLWTTARWVGVGYVALLAFLLGTLASVNLWELPTYLGLGLLLMLVGEFREHGRVRWGWFVLVGGVYLVGALLAYAPFFGNYVNVGASGIGWVRGGDALGDWLLVWGGLGFFVVSWLWFEVTRAGRRHALAHSPTLAAPALPPAPASAGEEDDEFIVIDAREDAAVNDSFGLYPAVPVTPMIPGAMRPMLRRPVGEPAAGVARWVGIVARRFDRLPRAVSLHGKLVMQPTFAYMLGLLVGPGVLLAAVAAWLLERQALGVCLALLALGLPLLWRRSHEVEPGTHLATLLAVTGLAILGGTQVVYLKDFLQGGDYYRMNTLFKFFSQVWVLWGLAAAIALPKLWEAGRGARQRGRLWRTLAAVVVVMSAVYVLNGTPARLDQRFIGWRPAWGTLDGLAFMEQGVYTWPNEGNPIELRYDVEAIRWLLENVRGNAVIVESAEVDYYRAGGSRVASMTGLSGLRGMHESEQRYGEQVGARDALHREFWATPDLARTAALLDELQVTLIYVGQLERYLHPDGVAKLQTMATQGQLDVLFENERVTVWVVPGQLTQNGAGVWVPRAAAAPSGSQLPSVGMARAVGP
jgi:uncharacterized membrane protein